MGNPRSFKVEVRNFAAHEIIDSRSLIIRSSRNKIITEVYYVPP